MDWGYICYPSLKIMWYLHSYQNTLVANKLYTLKYRTSNKVLEMFIQEFSILVGYHVWSICHMQVSCRSLYHQCTMEYTRHFQTEAFSKRASRQTPFPIWVSFCTFAWPAACFLFDLLICMIGNCFQELSKKFNMQQLWAPRSGG